VDDVGRAHSGDRRAGDDALTRVAFGVALVACLGTAGIHAALVPGHATAQPLLAAAFITAAGAAGIAAALLPARRRAGALLAVAVLATSLGAYAVDRAVGLPLLGAGHAHGGVDAVGLGTKALEAVGLWGAIVTLLARSSPMPLPTLAGWSGTSSTAPSRASSASLPSGQGRRRWFAARSPAATRSP
jgi:hypothetical protein